MVLLFAFLILPLLLIFGIYHVTLWINLGGMKRLKFWRRVALASGIGHLLLGAGFLALMYLDYRASIEIVPSGQTFEAFVLGREGFWRVLLVFDPIPGIALAGLFGIAIRLGWDLAPSLVWTFGVVFLMGTLQWYWVGAALGAGCERLWSGLKTPDDDLPDWM